MQPFLMTFAVVVAYTCGYTTCYLLGRQDRAVAAPVRDGGCDECR